MKNNTWNQTSGTIKPGRWDHITQAMRDAERQKIKKMSDKKLIAYFHEASVPQFKRSAQWEIVMIRKLMTFNELWGGE